MTLLTLFLVLALICFILAVIPVPVGRINLIALGLAFWALGLLLAGRVLH